MLHKYKKEVLDGHTYGVVQVDSRTKNLTKRLLKGRIAVIDHVDIDRVSAENLVACKPIAVFNAAKSTSGRYPNLGPEIINDAGIVLIDDLGADVMDLNDGDDVSFTDDGGVYVDGQLIAQGTIQTSSSIAYNLAEARSGMTAQLQAFVANTMEYVGREQNLIFDGLGIPDVQTKFEGKHVLMVVRGHHYKEDLVTLRPYIREYRPLLIGVDGGADALLDLGYRPDMIIGDMDSVSDKALKSGAEIVVHAYRDGNAPGKKRLEDLEIPYVVFPCTGTSEDVAMLLADGKNASLIVAVGAHNTLNEFLDKGRNGMASTFLTRLAVGGKLVDAKGVSRLYRAKISNLQLFFLVVSGILATGVAMWGTDFGHIVFTILRSYIDDFTFFVKGLF
ncbi:MAG: hypothetical protein J6M18_00945 [Actinomycetaceae bacterium]|nr:hypothetical protein [Actinomycetaceae bacterium]